MKDSNQKILGQAMLQVNQILKPFNRYGMNEYVNIAQNLIKELIEQVIERSTGEDVPIVVDPRRIKY